MTTTIQVERSWVLLDKLAVYAADPYWNID